MTVKRLGEFEELGGGVFHRVRAGLGVESFGINVEVWPPNSQDYPEHDEGQSGQEEVYTVLEGSATLVIQAHGDFELERGVFARVGPGIPRKIVPGPEGVTLLCIGAIPGKPYEPPPPMRSAS